MGKSAERSSGTAARLLHVIALGGFIDLEGQSRSGSGLSREGQAGRVPSAWVHSVANLFSPSLSTPLPQVSPYQLPSTRSLPGSKVQPALTQPSKGSCPCYSPLRVLARAVTSERASGHSESQDHRQLLLTPGPAGLGSGLGLRLGLTSTLLSTALIRESVHASVSGCPGLHGSRGRDSTSLCVPYTRSRHTAMAQGHTMGPVGWGTVREAAGTLGSHLEQDKDLELSYFYHWIKHSEWCKTQNGQGTRPSPCPLSGGLGETDWEQRAAW